MADRPSAGDRIVRDFGDAVASIRTALIDRAWFGYEELARSHDTHGSTAPHFDRSVEQGVPTELVDKAWLHPGRTEFADPLRKDHDVGRDFMTGREHQPAHERPGLDIDR